ncbi:hypothetical protein [Blastococcus sp. CCUG 61487]|uniref:hypothetical protein n=1 Tax=Blastococcus sp. CCUG 61487 TaxID=1840703 RepID=UPI0010C05A8C|nr:hypothetical protein [Blastococcus sp. CCUG 61487]TKJ25243.1 hypothetical protein A6V29_04265 [Blastococcus sp. CCUG 61487]
MTGAQRGDFDAPAGRDDEACRCGHRRYSHRDGYCTAAVGSVGGKLQACGCMWFGPAPASVADNTGEADDWARRVVASIPRPTPAEEDAATRDYAETALAEAWAALAEVRDWDSAVAARHGHIGVREFAAQFLEAHGHAPHPAAFPGGQGDHGERISTSCAKWITVQRGEHGTRVVIDEPERGLGTSARSMWANLSPRSVRELIDALNAACPRAAELVADDGRTEELRGQIAQTMAATWRDGRCFVVQEDGPPATDWRSFADELIAGPLAPLLDAAAPPTGDGGQT